MSNNTLALCMIVKDEEVFLQQCLDSVKDYVDEIIIVDTGSVDATKEIATAFTDALYDFEWIDNFSAARNYSLDKASSDWILVLDADEQISREDLQSIAELLSSSACDAYSLMQRNYGDDPGQDGWHPLEQANQYSKNYSGYRNNPIIRLFRNREDIRYSGYIHEIIDHELLGIKVELTDIPIHHDINGNPARSLQQRQLNYLGIIEKELEIRPSGRLFASAAAVCLYFKKDYVQAVEYYQKVIDLDYDRQKNLEGLAEAHYRLEEYKESYVIYTELVAANYLTPTLCNNLANLLVLNKDYATAQRILKMALELGNRDAARVARIEHNIEALGKLIEQN